jgi:transcriptional regulator with XRE-family HTH domain
MKKIDPAPIGDRIRAERKTGGIRQKEMAAGLGISLGNLPDIENGKTIPGAGLLLRLHKWDRIGTVYLLHGRGFSRRGSAGSLSINAATFDGEIDTVAKLVSFMNISAFFKDSILALAAGLFVRTRIGKKMIDLKAMRRKNHEEKVQYVHCKIRFINNDSIRCKR